MNTNRNERVIVGMSGGVDSSVAALRLLEAGYAVEGLFMKNWEEDDTPEYCSAAEDLADAEAVCHKLGIPLRSINFAAEYWDRVFEYFLQELRAGRTPNPDVLCNQEIKFRAFLDHALGEGARWIATGHYARIDQRDGRHRLLKGRDRNKDQSYFLYLLNQHALRHSLFPLGELDKTTVRRMAAEAGLPTASKKDSTGICFIGERRFADFIARYLPATPGDMVTPEGKVVGRHRGLMYYTYGQRQGLGIGGRRDAGDEPWYVVDKDLDCNRLIVAQGADHPLLFPVSLDTGPAHWIAGEAPDLPLRCAAKTRYRQPDQPCMVESAPDGCLHVRFDTPQRAITPGQSVVFYQDDHCLGGATINRFHRQQAT